MATTITPIESNSVGERATVEVMPMIVTIAPGPNISGIASGMNVMLEFAPEPFVIDASPADGDPSNSSKPSRIRMTPRVMRTKLKDTANNLERSSPKARKTKQSNSA